MSRVLLLGALALAVVAPSRIEARCPERFASSIVDPFVAGVRASCDCCTLGVRAFWACAQPLIDQAVENRQLSRHCARRALRPIVRPCRALLCPSSSTTLPGAGDGLRWYATCGYPVCRIDDEPIPGVPSCTSQRVGETCHTRDATCDPGVGCGVRLRCTDFDPARICPISRREAKRDIAYLVPDDLDRLLDEIRRVRLARYRYTADPAGRPHLGFIIDDDPRSPAVAADGDHVDLYGYTSMAIAAIQAQQRRIDALEREVAELRRALHRR